MGGRKNGLVPFQKKSSKRLKLFVSHRYDEDDAFICEVKNRIARQLSVEWLCLTQDQMLEGPRGGRVPNYLLMKEVSDRLKSSDAIICPNTKAITANNWISWEVEVAGVVLEKPVVFVNRDLSVQRNTSLFTELCKINAKVEVCGNDGQEMKDTIEKLIAY